MCKNWMLAGIMILFGGMFASVQAQDQHTHNLVKNLLKIGYPVERVDVLMLDKIGMRFDAKNRIDLLEQVLGDRESIHGHLEIDYFIRTEVICDALRLLDEHNLPVVKQMIDALNQQTGWERREKALLTYMAAKRGIRYEPNARYLLEVLTRYEQDLKRIYDGDASLVIIDIMNSLSYLADLYVYKGDPDILDALLLYSSHAHGFPAEYLSHMFVDMFLLRPKIFVSRLALNDDRTVSNVSNALVFGIRNNQIRQKVKGVLQKDLFTAEERKQANVALILKKLKAQIEPAINETLPN